MCVIVCALHVRVCVMHSQVRCVKRVLGQPWREIQSMLPTLPFVAEPGPSEASSTQSSLNSSSTREGTFGSEGGGEDGGIDGESEAIGGGDEEEDGVLIRVGNTTSTSTRSGCASNSSSSKAQSGAWVSPLMVSAAVAQELRIQAEAYLNDRSHRRFSEMSKALHLDGQGTGNTQHN